jgi:hypothetical protein
MKKSEFKEYLKTEILKMNEEANIEVSKAEDAAKIAKVVPDANISVKESKVKKSEFKEYLRNEILAEIAEQEEEEAVGAEEEVTTDTEEFDIEDEASFEFEPTGEGDIDAITDALVKLAKDAKTAGQVELANQILNSAKFSAKTEFKKVEKEA